MDQEEIEVIGLQVLERPVECVFNILGFMICIP